MPDSNIVVQSRATITPRETFDFNAALNTAGMLAKSDLIPDQFRNKPANVLIAMNLASRLNADIFHIMQSIYVVHGRPAFAGQFYIACINTSGRYAPIRYEETKDENGQTVACRVITTDLRTRQQVEGPWVSLDMARKEGWIKNNPKWSSMPELMLRYRAAAFFTRTYCPDVTMGVPIEGEQEDISAAAPPPTITAAEPVVTIRPTYEPDEKAQAYADALRESATREELHRVLTAIGLDDKLTEADKNFLRPIAAAQTKKLSD